MRNLSDLQREAKRAFENFSYPLESDENWKGILSADFKIEENEISDFSIQVKSGKSELLGKGGKIIPLENMSSNDFKKYFSDITFNDKFSAFHYGNLSGILIVIPKGVQIKENVEIVVKAGGEGIVCPHIVIVADEESYARVSILYETEKRFGPFFIGIERLFVNKGAVIDFSTWQNTSDNSRFISYSNSFVREAGNFKYLGVSTGGKISKQFVYCDLLEEGAGAELFGVYVADDLQRCSFNTYQNHKAKNTKSNLLFKGVLNDSSSGIFRGVIKVNPLAQKTDAYQANRNLIISKNAKAVSLPILEIEANDVRCTHGATVGKIDEGELFYLKSRGITEREAKKMIVSGFINEIIPKGDFGERIRKVIHGKIGGENRSEEKDVRRF